MKKIKLLTMIGALVLFGAMISKAEDATAKTVNTTPWVLSLSGAGNTILEGDGGTAVGGGIEIGKQGKILLPVEGGIRQNFTYQSSGNDAIFDTKLYFDAFPIHFHRFEAGAGLNFGATWGNTPIVYSAAPEGIVRFWVKEDVAIFGRVAYPFDLGNNKLGDRLDYVLGVSFRF